MKIKSPSVSWKRSLPCGLILCASLVGWTGCGGESGPPTGTIQGQVTFNGKPVTSGEITFYCGELGCGISESLNADGRFVTQTPLQTGAYVVSIIPPETPPPEDPSQLVVRVVAKDIPRKYRDPRKSGLTINVEEGVNSFDIEMQP